MTDQIPGKPFPEQKERGDLDDPKKVGRRGVLDRLQAKQQAEDTVFVLSSVQGRRFYWSLMKRCGIFQTSMTGNNSTFFNEGMRNVGLWLLSDLNELSPESYVDMIRESKFEEVKKQ